MFATASDWVRLPTNLCVGLRAPGDLLFDRARFGKRPCGGITGDARRIG
jgi:hypothetical protein